MRHGIVILLLIVPLGFGCVHVAGILGLLPKEPKIELTSVAIRKANLSGVELMVSLTVKNRDPKPLTMENLEFDLFLDDAPLGKAEVAEKVSIPKDESKVINIPVTVNFSDSVDIVKNFIGGNPPKMARVMGSVVIDTKVGNMKVPFSKDTNLRRDGK